MKKRLSVVFLTLSFFVAAQAGSPSKGWHIGKFVGFRIYRFFANRDTFLIPDGRNEVPAVFCKNNHYQSWTLKRHRAYSTGFDEWYGDFGAVNSACEEGSIKYKVETF